MQNFLYALIQLIHNIGAVTIVGVGAYGLFVPRETSKRMLAAAQAVAWGAQGLTGIAFGLTTFYFYHQLPDIHGIAIVALTTKVTCVIAGFLMASFYVIWCPRLSASMDRVLWIILFILGLTALSSAGFLRWFS